LVALLDLVLPAPCSGCGASASRFDLCDGCTAELAALVPGPVRPDPAPDGLPACRAVGVYQGRLRELIVAYKERGRRALAAPLGDRLAAAVAGCVPGDRDVVLVPVPTTARAARERRGDHVLPLVLRAARRLRQAGRAVVVLQALRALPRPDSTGLTAAERARVARSSLVARPGLYQNLEKISVSGAPAVVVADDVMTTGATIAATREALASAGLVVDAAAVLAATQRRRRYAR
jgi:predicted amidophosphoribosyltransferase